MKKITILVLLITGLFALASDISDYHFQQARAKLGKGPTKSFDENDARADHNITVIGIQRTRCFGTCPAYQFIAKSDGTFRYKGGAYVQRLGEFTGTVDAEDFHNLAQFIKDSGYMKLNDDYEPLAYDLPTTFTMVVMDGKPKTVRNAGFAGPKELKAIEQRIDHMMAEAKWDGTPKTPTPKK